MNKTIRDYPGKLPGTFWADMRIIWWMLNLDWLDVVIGLVMLVLYTILWAWATFVALPWVLLTGFRVLNWLLGY